MDSTQVKDFITWLVGSFLVSIVTLAGGFYAIVKSGKMIPREVKGADLNNKSKEVSIADQLDELATKAADRAIKTQERFDVLQGKYDEVIAKLENQEKVIEEQQKLIQGQGIRLDEQELRIKDQEEEISNLLCELENSKLYIDALIQQMKEANIVPVKIESLPLRKPTIGRRRTNDNVK